MKKRKSMSKFAARTKVPTDKTRWEIEVFLTKNGATRFAFMNEANRAIIVFEANDRRIRFTLSIPERASSQQRQSKWRALFLAIKSKIVSVESGIETWEEAFMAHVVMPDGKTVYEHSAARIASAYKGDPMQPLLPGPN